MPNRIIRASLRESDRFLTLPDNDCRAAFVFCLLVADDFGNMEATPGALARLWRDIGITSSPRVAAVAASLAAADLVRFYQANGKRYAHIPRFRQRVRHERNAHPKPGPEIDAEPAPETATTKPVDNLPTGKKTTPPSSKVTEGKQNRIKERKSETTADRGRTTVERPSNDGVGDVEVKKFKSEIQKRDLVDSTAYRRPTAANGKGAQSRSEKPHGNSAPATPHGNPDSAPPELPGDPGQQWSNPAWVAATARLVDVAQAQGESPQAFRDRVFAALQQRMRRATR